MAASLLPEPSALAFNGMTISSTSDFATAFRRLRHALEVQQTQFDAVSGRTYVSKLERRERIPTLGKIDELAGVLGIHPLTLLTLCYCPGEEGDVAAALARVRDELDHIGML